MNDTIRNNILFRPALARWALSWVLGRLCPHADLALLSHGDQTLVGNPGTRPAASNSGSPGLRPLRPGRHPAAG